MPAHHLSRPSCDLHGGMALALMLSLLPAYQSPAQSAEGGSCQLESGGESTVLAVSGPQTLRLADGRSVRLAEILAPSALPGSAFDPSAAAAAYLRSAALGQKVEVKFGGSHRDRYGSTLAHVYVLGQSPVWLQEGLVSGGLALAFPQPDNHACSEELASLEEKARGNRKGHWSLALFKVLSASDTRAILNLVQTYQIVEGKVSSVTHSGERATIHFGAESKLAFTATIEPSARKQLAEEPEEWQGELIRIRGWIERKKGPTISVSQPQQIELLRQEPDKPALPEKAQ